MTGIVMPMSGAVSSTWAPSLRRTWLACEKAFDQAATDARISA